jgi:hypothetical protein
MDFDSIFLALAGLGIVATIVGFVSLGVAGSRKQHQLETDERRLATYRRRMLLGMLDERRPHPH